LIVYWLLTVALWLVLGLTCLGCLWVRDFRSRIVTPAVRAQMTALLVDPWSQQLITQSHGSVEAYVDYICPLAFDVRTFRHYATVRRDDLLWVPILLVWPGLTFAALMIFQISMRRARVRPIHVLRCVIYSFSTIVWMALIAGLLTAAIVIVRAYGRGSVPGIRYAPVTLSAFLMLATIYHLIVAFRRYLRFDHSLATVLASQVIGILAVFSAFALGSRLFSP
jgi:hypothetical protein